MLKRQNLFAGITVVSLLLISIFFIYTKQNATPVIDSIGDSQSNVLSSANKEQEKIIMGAMGNQTERAELGRATWKFLHTMMARYPEKPEPKDRQSLHDFMYLFSTLYPCGECATHFNKLITTYPPQTSSRFAASQWLCTMHNKVNERLKKPIFDCSDIDSKYPCGCADEATEASD